MTFAPFWFCNFTLYSKLEKLLFTYCYSNNKWKSLEIKFISLFPLIYSNICFVFHSTYASAPFSNLLLQNLNWDIAVTYCIPDPIQCVGINFCFKTFGFELGLQEKWYNSRKFSISSNLNVWFHFYNEKISSIKKF